MPDRRGPRGVGLRPRLVVEGRALVHVPAVPAAAVARAAAAALEAVEVVDVVERRLLLAAAPARQHVRDGRGDAADGEQREHHDGRRRLLLGATIVIC